MAAYPTEGITAPGGCTGEGGEDGRVGGSSPTHQNYHSTGLQDDTAAAAAAAAGGSKDGSLSGGPVRPKQERVCVVCSDRALGYNFNAITCESCKAFFRRNALLNKTLTCPFKDNCLVDSVTRRFCQKCRLRKCFDAGMKKEWIMSSEEKAKKKKKIEANKMRKFGAGGGGGAAGGSCGSGGESSRQVDSADDSMPFVPSSPGFKQELSLSPAESSHQQQLHSKPVVTLDMHFLACNTLNTSSSATDHSALKLKDQQLQLKEEYSKISPVPSLLPLPSSSCSSSSSSNNIISSSSSSSCSGSSQAEGSTSKPHAVVIGMVRGSKSSAKVMTKAARVRKKAEMRNRAASIGQPLLPLTRHPASLHGDLPQHSNTESGSGSSSSGSVASHNYNITPSTFCSPATSPVSVPQPLSIPVASVPPLSQGSPQDDSGHFQRMNVFTTATHHQDDLRTTPLAHHLQQQEQQQMMQQQQPLQSSRHQPSNNNSSDFIIPQSMASPEHLHGMLSECPSLPFTPREGPSPDVSFSSAGFFPGATESSCGESVSPCTSRDLSDISSVEQQSLSGAAGALGRSLSKSSSRGTVISPCPDSLGGRASSAGHQHGHTSVLAAASGGQQFPFNRDTLDAKDWTAEQSEAGQHHHQHHLQQQQHYQPHDDHHQQRHQHLHQQHYHQQQQQQQIFRSRLCGDDGLNEGSQLNHQQEKLSQPPACSLPSPDHHQQQQQLNQHQQQQQQLNQHQQRIELPLTDCSPLQSSVDSSIEASIKQEPCLSQQQQQQQAGGAQAAAADQAAAGKDDWSDFRVLDALQQIQPGNQQQQQPSPTDEHRSDSSPMDNIVDSAVQAEYSPFSLQGASARSCGSSNSCKGHQQHPCIALLSAAEQQKLGELQRANVTMMMPLSEDQHYKEQHNPSLINVINLTDIAIRRLIQMSKQLPPFYKLCTEDQIALLKGSCTEILILRAVAAYDVDKDSWQIQSNHDTYKSIKLKVLQGAPGNVQVYEEHKRFILAFKPEWRHDQNIMLLLSAITLFTPTRRNVRHPKAIEYEQGCYLYLLKRYLESCMGGCEGRTVYCGLLERINDLRRLNENHLNVYMQVNPQEIEPLLTEIFDLDQR